MKYCPLCEAEYRQAVKKCVTCGAALVSSLDEEEVRANPPRLLWNGRDHQECDRVTAALSETGVPLRTYRALGGLIGSITQRPSTIHVLTDDFPRALEIAAGASVRRQETPTQAQTCYNCSATCSAFLAACPTCKSQLITEPRMDEKSIFSTSPRTDLKYCPVCDTEYGSGYELCTVCGVELVSEGLRGRPLNEKERKERIVIVWRGGDPVAVSGVLAALREAGIQHHVQASSDHLVFELAMPRPKYLVRVFASDLPRANELLAGIPDRSIFGWELSADFPESAAAPRSASREPWTPAAATREIWSGRDAALAKVLEDCFMENGISFRRHGLVPGTLRYFVLPSDESAAREIVREVLEGTPPA